MNILVLGSGGREHALCWKIKQSPHAEKLYCAPGNGGTREAAENIGLDISDNDAIKGFCKERDITLVIVGPEAPLARGITDVLEGEGIKVCGPSYAAARMESSKIFAKELMGRYSIPSASFRIFDDVKKAEDHIRSAGAPVVIKADGLAGGKGVIVAGSVSEANNAVKAMLEEKVFGAAGNKIIVEECLKGEEISILALTDGTNIIPLAPSQDHKRVFEGDKGPNTGGMGAYSPVPFVDEKLFEDIRKTILQPTVDSLREEGMPYKGILYAGLMITDAGPKVLEFNARFGDPEAQVLLPGIKTDLVELLMSTAEMDLSNMTIEWDDRDRVCVVLVSAGYPGGYEKGNMIEGIQDAVNEGVLVFHAGTEARDGKPVTSGGRVLGVVGTGNGIKEAADNAYRGVEKIRFKGMYYRRDIAYRAVDQTGFGGGDLAGAR